MRRAHLASAAVLLALVWACTGDDPILSKDTSSSDAGTTSADAATDSRVDDDGASGTDAAAADGASSDAADDAAPCVPPGSPVVLFLDRAGGSWTPGATDSRSNLSALLGAATSVPAWTIAPASWTALMACVVQKFKPFNVQVTDVDPGVAATHLEVVFAPGNLPLFGGAAANGPATCAVVPNSVAFVSTTYADANLDNGCAAVASVVGSSLGLEPVTACPDAMAYPIASCATAAFTNVALSCGTTVAKTCDCQAGSTQNSYARILAVTGPACL